jgi:hypothetical protein
MGNERENNGAITSYDSLAKPAAEEALGNFRLRKSENGQVISMLAGPTANTCTWVKFAAPLIDQQVREACVIVRQNPDIAVEQLRSELPLLSKCSSDSHLIRIINSYGEARARELTDQMIADAAAGWGLSVDTVGWYRTHPSRQVKSKKRGRPRKSK